MDRGQLLPPGQHEPEIGPRHSTPAPSPGGSGAEDRSPAGAAAASEACLDTRTPSRGRCRAAGSGAAALPRECTLSPMWGWFRRAASVDGGRAERPASIPGWLPPLAAQASCPWSPGHVVRRGSRRRVGLRRRAARGRRFLGWVRVACAPPAGPCAAGTWAGRPPGLPAGPCAAGAAAGGPPGRRVRPCGGLSRTRTNASPPHSVRPGIDRRPVRSDAGRVGLLALYPAPERPAQTSGRRRPRRSAVGDRRRRGGTHSRPEASRRAARYWDGQRGTEQKVERIARPREGAEATRRPCAASRRRCRARCGGFGPSTSRASAGPR
jgi:hypothetical protein